jgi:hypothetical protein
MNVKTATAETRKAIRKTMAGVSGVTVNSRSGIDLDTLASTVVTVVTYPQGTDYTALAATVPALRVQSGDSAMTITYAA